MYNILSWKDHVITPNNTYTVTNNADGSISITPKGNVIQQGTNFSAENFNNMEIGIFDAHLANKLLSLAVRDLTDRLSAAEAKIAALTTE